MIDVFIRTNSTIEDIPKALSGFPDGARVLVRNGGPTEAWVHSTKGWVQDQPGMTLYEDLSADFIELYGYVTKWVLTEPIDAPCLRLTEDEAKQWLASMKRAQYLLEDGIGCSVDVDVDGHTLTCAVATFALSDFKRNVTKPGTELNDKILIWADEMLKAGADSIDVCISRLPRVPIKLRSRVARSLKVGDVIKNPMEGDDLIILTGVSFVPGESFETDGIVFSCEHGSAGFAAVDLVEVVLDVRFQDCGENSILAHISETTGHGNSQYAALNDAYRKILEMTVE